MEQVSDTLPLLSGTLAGLALAALTVLIVVFVVLAIYRKGRTTEAMQQSLDTKPQRQPKQEPVDKTAESIPQAPSKAEKDTDSSEPVEPEHPPTEQAPNIVELVHEDEDATARAERFQKLASVALEEGRLGEARTLFEKTLAVATDNDVKPSAAIARYELGNLSKAGGDLLSACEHWQMARTLYQELGDKRKVRELDNIMQDSGCPSDWVLNNF